MGQRVLAVLAVVLIAAGCSTVGPGANGPESTFTQNGYTVICRWTRTAISGGGGTPTVGPESESFCRSRAREAVGTLLIGVPGAEIQTVTIAADGSATVCYGSKDAADLRRGAAGHAAAHSAAAARPRR